MSRLFVEDFLVQPEQPAVPPPALVYDEAASLNLTASGRPAVELEVGGDTTTLTFVDAEKEDRDAAEASPLDTVTKVRAEGAEADFLDLAFGTETRQVPAEREDFARDLDGGTKTSVAGEAEDFARDEAPASLFTSPGWAPASTGVSAPQG